MLKRVIRLLLPLIALLMFAAYLVISPIVASHAAAPLMDRRLICSGVLD